MKLEKELFETIVRFTPLISIDLIVFNEKKEVLAGWRKNAPAKNTWFIPGGRILKDETISEAFKRISLHELGRELSIENAEFRGVYEHLYPGDNYQEDNSFGTHYIVLGFIISGFEIPNQFPPEQHENYRWFSEKEILEDPLVHRNVKNYFLKGIGYRTCGK
ncbi:MAG: GDP-mannose mannosyl hydrolase [Bacteroidales bacterium]|nr:GDP-mannose mannosyl hydrolase [Bacteroidales bacterium]